MTDLDTLSQRQPQLVEMLLQPPILEVLRSYLIIPDFLELFQVCRRLYLIKDRTLRSICGINIALKNFVRDATLFRSQLGHYNAVISGSFALNFFQLSNKKVSHLDIFVKDGAGADQFTDYLQRTEEYKNDSEVDRVRNQCQECAIHVQFPLSPLQIPGRRVYSRTLQPNIRIRVTRTTGPPIQAILTSSSTTATINAITWNKAYSVFPRQTLIKHEFYPLRPLDNDFGSELSELSPQGWTTRDIVWPDHARDKLRNLIGVRRVGGSSSLVIPLDTTSVTTQPVPDYIIEYAQFEILGDGLQYRQTQIGLSQFGQNNFQNNAPRWSYLQIKAKELSSPAFCHCYITTSSGWRDFVSERVLRWAWLELYKIEQTNRPAQPLASFPLVSDVSISTEFEFPQSWDYADDQIPIWYRQWKDMNSEGGVSGRQI
ncbi:Maleylacetate reductase [Fusarium oxysporum f. sp. albedinis]|nr:Maleylacetate reductase [Fusarium oxysporum f. sp. albedinis]